MSKKPFCDPDAYFAQFREDPEPALKPEEREHLRTCHACHQAAEAGKREYFGTPSATHPLCVGA